MAVLLYIRGIMSILKRYFINRGAKMYKISILKTPTNKYIFIGSLPLALCNKIEKRSICGADYRSKIFNTEKEAIDLLKKEGD